jgi:hypothetical protein
MMPKAATIVIDPDAQAFINAAAITNPTQQNAINALVIGLKAQGLWTKMRAIYPFVGGTASTHKFNLKDPRDLNAAFRLVFNGGWTHSNNGVQGNGVNNWMNTFFNPQTQFSANLSSSHFSIYSRTIIPLLSGQFPVFIYTPNQDAYLYVQEFNGQIDLWGYMQGENELYGNITSSNTLGLFTISRINNLSNSLYRNQSNLATGIDSQIVTYTSNIVTLGGNDSIAQYSNNQYAFSTIGTGLTNTDTSNLYTLVQTFQTTLGRQV